jgi:hypothetical protein
LSLVGIPQNLQSQTRNRTQRAMEWNQSNLHYLPRRWFTISTLENLIALVAVDQSETIVTVEEDGKDAVIFIGNSALARVIGAAKTLTPEHVTFMSSKVVDILNADTRS